MNNPWSPGHFSPSIAHHADCVNALLVGVIDGHPIVLDAATNPSMSYDEAPPFGTWLEQSHDDILSNAPELGSSGLWLVTYRICGNGPDHNGEYDSWTESTWTRVEVDDFMNDHLTEEHAAWAAALKVWPCGYCGQLLGAHGVGDQRCP